MVLYIKKTVSKRPAPGYYPFSNKPIFSKNETKAFTIVSF